MLASLAVLVLVAVPAWAGASFNGSTELQADSDVRLELVMTEEEELGRTTQVVVTVPKGFAALDCTAVGWECTVEGRAMTFRRTAVGELVSSSFYLDVHTAAINGSYAFAVTQSNGDGTKTMTFRPTVTVVGGEEPAPEPSPSPSPEQSPATGDDGADASPSPASSPSPSAGSSATDEADQADDTDASDDRGGAEGGSGGSTAPRRTQGRSAGTTLEVTPGEPVPQEQPDVSAPDVADGPAVAPPDGAVGTDEPADEDAETVAAGDGGPTGGGPGGEVPWQQWAGGALLLVGAAVLVVRRWGGQLAGAGATVAGRVRGVGSAAIGRIPGPWGG